MRRTLLLLGAWLLLALPAVQAQEDDPTLGVTLKGYAVLPADTFAEGPASGAFIDPANGRTPPFENQPVQGVSAILPGENGHYWVMSDNGYGSKANSPDYNLRFYEVQVNFDAGSVEVLGFTELSDPDQHVPFPIIHEDTEARVLTGADFDIESFRQVADGTFWFGEEFGPYLVHVDASGKVLEAPIPTPYPDVLAPYARGLDFIQSPDNPAFVDLADQPARIAAANLPSSKGFEGMALNTSGTLLYPLMEGVMSEDPLRTRLLIQEFDLASASYTGRYFFYPMDNPGYAIGDMTAINDHELLIIERDGGQGESAAFKRIYRVDLETAAPDGVLRKWLVVDLMNIGDPNGLTTPEDGAIGYGEIFSFPFVTIESVYPVDAQTLIVTNDNNYPFSSGRRPGLAPDDNEFILLSLPEALNLAQ